ncbi:MAG TPA: glutamate--tRNA ligase [Candidatus Dojkabacteria bacterium]|nr:glutamate--tRNA ligase [Candidatus Dojkabacteria bacterium]HQF36623.1 glutamate--tRNA ligase [Candidatus Dojkabacteria bacterium]
MTTTVRTRFAPSPTGFFHIGNLRTALYSYALAKGNKGVFVLRVEDTDKKRYVEGSIDNLIQIITSFGIDYDEGPIKGGKYGPYVQSERLEIYKKKAEELVEKGYAYYCFLTLDEVNELKVDKKIAFRSPHRNLSSDEVKDRLNKGEKYVIRLKVPSNRTLTVFDELLGKIEWDSNTIDDTVLLKADGFPTYHLGVVVDDYMMGITHITRGIEWLPSVPKHILLFEGFGYPFPKVAHMPVILDPAGGKLSKRKGNVSTSQFLEEGYLEEALLNFIMLLGWSPNIERKYGEREREIFSLKEFVELFDMKDLNKSSPVFDREKLLWFNGQYIRNMGVDKFVERFRDWSKKYLKDDFMQNKILNDKELGAKLVLVKDRVHVLSEIPGLLRFFYEVIKIPNLLEVKGLDSYKSEDLKKAIDDYSKVLSSYDEDSSKWIQDNWVADIRSLADKYAMKHADMFMLVRVYICGSAFSPPLFEAMQILGKEECIRRIN